MRALFCLAMILLTAPAFAQGNFQDVLNSVASDEPGETPAAAPVQAQPTPAPVAAPAAVKTTIVQTTVKAPAAQAAASATPSYEPQKYAVLQTLDKLTARTATVTIPVNRPSAVGPLFIDVKTCQKTPPSEQPESAAFLQVWEAKPKSILKDAPEQDGKQSQWVFSGWMFASSPALSGMNHRVYDVWVKDCTNDIAVAAQK